MNLGKTLEQLLVVGLIPVSTADGSDGICRACCVARHSGVDLEDGVDEGVYEGYSTTASHRVEMKAPPVPVT